VLDGFQQHSGINNDLHVNIITTEDNVFWNNKLMHKWPLTPTTNLLMTNNMALPKQHAALHTGKNH